MSKLTSTRSTGKSFGYPSQKQIQVWSSQGRRKASLFAKKNYQTMELRKNSRLSIDNEEELQYAFNSSLNQLREKTKTQKSNSSSISNRMSYLEVDMRRKKQLMELAKSKYHRMIEVRHKSFVEKKELSKERQSLISQHHQSVTLKASRIRSERKNTVMSSQIIKEKNQTEAMRIKQQRFINQKIVAERKMMEIERKKQMVQKTHKYEDYSREKLKNIEEKKFKQAKVTHDFKLLNEYMKGEMQKRKNTKLYNNFQSKVKKIEDEANRVKHELKQYEKMLGWNYSNKTGKKSRTSQSFYMTH